MALEARRLIESLDFSLPFFYFAFPSLRKSAVSPTCSARNLSGPSGPRKCQKCNSYAIHPACNALADRMPACYANKRRVTLGRETLKIREARKNELAVNVFFREPKIRQKKSVEPARAVFFVPAALNLKTWHSGIFFPWKSGRRWGN